MHTTLKDVTDRIIERSKNARSQYLARIDRAMEQGRYRSGLSCGNLAHGFAACSSDAKKGLRSQTAANVAIVSSYNDMLSAHKPFERFPDIIRQAAKDAGGVAQFAGGVPAMCDGVTQGQPGMELSLFSRDLVAMATAVALSHNMFDAVLCLGVCDKIVPGLLIGALSFGHLPTVFVPAGPMDSGLPNKEKARIRQLFAEGKITRAQLLDAESKSYHSAGTCTFYGTANSNQMMMELMGLHVPGSAFIKPTDPLRDQLTRAATERALNMTRGGDDYKPLGHVVDERAIVNAIVGLLATGGSTNHTLHLVAIGRAAGVIINWDDFSELSKVVPLLARIYPNGPADVNHFHDAGGLGFVIRELLDAGLLHEDILTVSADGFRAYTTQPALKDGDLVWEPLPKLSGDRDIVREYTEPFQANGGMSVLDGNLGRAVMKTSAVLPEHRTIEAPARVFDCQRSMLEAFEKGELNKDVVCVVRYQGPRANGMPELHKLMPSLRVLQARGYNVALVTDGRLSGASGAVPAAIHVTPECLDGGPLSKVRDGDIISIDAEKGVLEVSGDGLDLISRIEETPDLSGNQTGMGRELFEGFRRVATGAEQGAMVLSVTQEELSHV
ncbi:MAG: phosphogluconate dehydratase [Deltaproteobacteria bacterium]|jgi:phosphogluconate dehydratase|nr:phosphogluconate dehydratase [Deltaproteobacteria bacterium]MBT6491635.1 phosphogluconate dehydratase [Deltaproteobacteria bacterium]